MLWKALHPRGSDKLSRRRRREHGSAPSAWTWRSQCSKCTIVRRQVRRAQLLACFAKLPACLVGVEACATAHHWAREQAWPPGPAHAAEPREAVRQAAEERRG